MWTVLSRIFCQEFNLDLPIIQAPMAGGPTTPELVISVSEGGGLGSVGAGYMSPESLRASLASIKSHTEKPFSVNVFVPTENTSSRKMSGEAKNALSELAREIGGDEVNFAPNNPNYFKSQLEVVLELSIPILSFTFGMLSDQDIFRFKQCGVKLIGTATCVEEALALEALGCDAITAQGFEAGGHRGSFMREDALVGLIALIPQMVDRVKIPVIASGGIMDGRAIVACLSLGAGAVQMGTAFLVTQESGADEVWKDAVINSDATSTQLTKTFSGKPARGIVNKFMRHMEPYENQVFAYPIQNQITGPIRARARQLNNSDFMSLWSGQGGNMSRKVSASDLLVTLANEVDQTLLKFER